MDLLTAGFPCQDVSIAGKRAGLEGQQTGLWFELAKVIETIKPRWIVLENVPGLLSSRQGQDMAEIISTLSEVGYCVVWTVLDAQYFGVAQRRKRVWIIGSFGNFGAEKVLAILQGNQGNDKKKQKMGERGLCISTRDGDRNDPTNETLIAFKVGAITSKSYGDKGWAPANEWNTIVAQTIGATIRGNTSFVWQDTYIAEINADRKREVNGVSSKLDSVRGKSLGNAIVPQVAEVIFRAIKKVEVKQKGP